MRYDPWLTEISPADIEAAMQRKAAREALIVEQAAEITRLRAELATARREGMEQAAKIAKSCAADWRKSAKGKYLETKWDYESRADAGEEIAAAICAAANEVN